MGLAAGFISAFFAALANVIVRSESDRTDVVALNAMRLLAAAPVAFVLPWLLPMAGTTTNYSWLSVFYVVAAAVSGILVGDLVFFKAQKILGVSRALPIGSTSPIFAMALSVVFLAEKPSWALVGSVVMVVVGVALLSSRKNGSSEEHHSSSPSMTFWGIALALLAAFLWSVGSVLVFMGTVNGSMDLATANQFRIPIIALASVSIVRFSGRPLRMRERTPRSWALVAAAGILGTAIGNLLFIYNMQQNGVTIASLVNSLSALFAVPLAVLFLEERITWRTALGMLCCLVAVWIVVTLPG